MILTQGGVVRTESHSLNDKELGSECMWKKTGGAIPLTQPLQAAKLRQAIEPIVIWAWADGVVKEFIKKGKNKAKWPQQFFLLQSAQGIQLSQALKLKLLIVAPCEPQ